MGWVVKTRHLSHAGREIHPNVPTVPLVGVLSVSVLSNSTVGDKEQWEHKEISQHLWFSGDMQSPEK